MRGGLDGSIVSRPGFRRVSVGTQLGVDYQAKSVHLDTTQTVLRSFRRFYTRWRSVGTADVGNITQSSRDPNPNH